MLEVEGFCVSEEYEKMRKLLAIVVASCLESWPFLHFIQSLICASSRISIYARFGKISCEKVYEGKASSWAVESDAMRSSAACSLEGCSA